MVTTPHQRYFCFLCLSPTDLRKGQNDICRRSLVANKTLEQMSEHLIAVHGYEKPLGYDEDKKKAKNKAKAKRRKKSK